MKSLHNASARRAQTGAALVVSMIVLLLMTTLALAASRSTRMQERMAGNMRDSELAFQAAEAAIRDGENFIAKQTAMPVLCSNADAACNFFDRAVQFADLPMKSRSWWKSKGRQYAQANAGATVAKQMQNVAEDPYSTVQEIGHVTPSLTVGRGTPALGRTFYRVTAYGVGGSGVAEAVVESTYSRAF